MSSAWVQTRLKQATEQTRFPPTADPESLLDRISLFSDIECCFYRGLIDAFQLRVLEIWLSTGEVISRYELLAALEAIATYSQYTDENLILRIKDIGGLSEQEIRHKLEELSETFTTDLDFVVKEETLPGE